MDDIDPLKLDRDISRAARAERMFWRALRADAETVAEDWYEPLRYVTTRPTFVSVSSMSDGDPLREPFRRWIHRLALTRIAAEPIFGAAHARQNLTIRLEKPEAGSFSVRGLVQRLVAERDVKRARLWLEGLTTAGSAVLSAEHRLRDAIDEITARLGVTDAAALVAYDESALMKECEHFLRRTDDLAAATLGAGDGDVASLVARLVARDVPGVWPARADARWLQEQFQSTPLLDGLSLDLGAAKGTLGGSSFARALARFGAAYGRAAVLGRGPFALAADATEAHPLRRGALFASLVADHVFLRKQLQLSREAASKTARALGVTFLAEVRLLARRVLIDFGRASPAQIAEAVESALSARVPEGLAGVLPRLSFRPSERVMGAFLAGDDARALRSAYDEDWFRNPRALLSLRENDATLRPLRLPPETLEGTAERAARALEELVG